MKIKISKSKNILKVGMRVRSNGSADETIEEPFIEGIIGEIQENKFYIWTNNLDFDGGIGMRSPASRGFKYSWVILFNNKFSWVEILDEAPVSKNIKQYSIVNWCKQYYK